MKITYLSVSKPIVVCNSWTLKIEKEPFKKKERESTFIEDI